MYRKDILIIEDDRVIALDLLHIVKAAGFSSVKVAFNPEDALSIARGSNVDILFSDIRLNHPLSGAALAKRLQECCRAVCVFISAFWDDETLKSIAHIDYADYVLKPFRAEEIEAALKLAVMRLPAASILPEPWRYDEATETLYRGETAIVLPPKEKILFHLLYRAKGSVVPYEAIEALLWPDGTVSDNARRQLFHRFKKRLEGLRIVLEKGNGIALKPAT